MKKYLVLLLPFMMVAYVANARFVLQPISHRPAIRLARSDMEFCDTNKDGFLTFEEYDKRKNRPMTLNDKKNIRQAKKKGYYKTNEQRFKEIDVEGKGKITLEDLERYYTKLYNENELMY